MGCTRNTPALRGWWQVPRRPWSSSPFCLVPRPGAHATVTSLRCRDVPFKRPFPGLLSSPYSSTQTLERAVCEHQGRGDHKGLGDSEPKIGVPGGGPAGLSCIPSRDKRLLPRRVRGPLPTPTVGEASVCSAHLNTEVGPWGSCWRRAGARCGESCPSGK